MLIGLAEIKGLLLDQLRPGRQSPQGHTEHCLSPRGGDTPEQPPNALRLGCPTVVRLCAVLYTRALPAWGESKMPGSSRSTSFLKKITLKGGSTVNVANCSF